MRLLNNNYLSRIVGGLLLAGLALSTSAGVAQDDNPFATPPDAGAPAATGAASDNPFGPSDTPAEPAGDSPFGAPDGDSAPAADSPFGPGGDAADAGGASPFGAGGGAAPQMPDATPTPPAEGGTPAPAAPKVPDDPAVQAVLESKPKSPFELLRAVRILADLGYPELAEPLARQLAAEQLDPQQQAALFKQFPSATLMRLARNPVLGKTLGPLIEGLYGAADAMRRDPARLAEYIQHLGDPSAEVRAQAMHELVRAGESAVSPLLTVLADPNRVRIHQAAKAIIVRLGGRAVPPLLGALESPDVAIRLQVIELLGAMKAGSAVASLLAPLASPRSTPLERAMAAAAIERISGRVPTSGEALQLLERAARQRLDQARRPELYGDRVVEIWQWDSAKQETAPVNYDETGAALAASLRLAADLQAIDSESPTRLRLYLTALLEAAKHSTGLDTPLPTEEGSAYAVAASYGPNAVEDVLASAMAEGYLPAAIAAARILGDIGTSAQLAAGGAAPSTLARAAGHDDRRLRFAAIEAIMKLKPRQAFAGSSAVTQGLGYFAGSYGVPRILVVHPLSAAGGQIAGLAAAQGYEADVATTGRQAFELATASPDYELIVIHSAIDRPALDELVAQLRRDRRTALVPIGIMAPANDMDRIQSYARRAGGIVVLPQPTTEAEMKLLADDVLASAGMAHVPVDVRRAQAVAAMDWLIQLAEAKNSVFDLRSLEDAVLPLVYVPQMAGKAIELLADIGTRKSQQTLIGLADSPVQPLATREAAVVALARSIRKYGTLLTTDEIYAQYDMYNYNAGRNRDTHKVLGQVLDVIEYQGDPPPPETAKTSGP
jgi:HEAT repeat protein